VSSRQEHSILFGPRPTRAGSPSLEGFVAEQREQAMQLMEMMRRTQERGERVEQAAEGLKREIRGLQAGAVSPGPPM
jgi:hypothetical protein